MKRALVKRETEILELVKKENIDIIFLTKTNIITICFESDYSVKGYVTTLQERKNPNDVIRIVGLVKEDLVNKMKVRFYLMNYTFPSIWIEMKEENKKPILLAGFHILMIFSINH